MTEIINDVLAIFPQRYRTSLFANDGRTIDFYAPSPIEHFEKFDPSEAIRSAEIINTLKLHFDILEIRPYGGAILHMLMSGIMGNFDENIDVDVAIIQIIATFEETLEKVGAIGVTSPPLSRAATLSECHPGLMPPGAMDLQKPLGLRANLALRF